MIDIKEKIHNNIRLYTLVQQIDRSLPVRSNGRAEIEYRSFIRSIEKTDPISDIDGFRKDILPLLSRDNIFCSNQYGAESAHYGYYHELVRYSEKKRGSIPLIPTMEHGIRFASPVWMYDKYSLSYACQGRNRIHEIHDTDPWKLVFSLGPYIHYSRDYYGRQRYEALKNELGKVLLVFPSHTWEESSLGGSSEGFARKIINKYSKKYDTLLICAYWKNICDPVIKQFEAEGAKIVSAGFRGCKNFIRRLKTIIRLADDVVVDDIGTNIGFCMYMNRPVFFEGGEQPSGNDTVFWKNHIMFRKAFYSENGEFSPDRLLMQRELYESFWGGEKELLSKAQAAKLFDAIETICLAADYHISRLPAAERAFINKCGDSEQRELIVRALSPKLKF